MVTRLRYNNESGSREWRLSRRVNYRAETRTSRSSPILIMYNYIVISDTPVSSRRRIYTIRRIFCTISRPGRSKTVWMRIEKGLCYY